MALRLPFGAVHGRTALFDGVPQGSAEGSPWRGTGCVTLFMGWPEGSAKAPFPVAGAGRETALLGGIKRGRNGPLCKISRRRCAVLHRISCEPR
jgi:hypothetical protein